MKKIKNIYLNSNDKLILVDTEGKHYQIDYFDYENPRWTEISENSIDYEKN